MKNTSFLVLVASIFSFTAFAQLPVSAESRRIEPRVMMASLESVLELRKFYDNQVSLFVLDAPESASSPQKIAVVVPDGSYLDFLVTRKTLDLGNYCFVDLAALQSKMHPTNGLTLEIPVYFYDLSEGACKFKETLEVKIHIRDGIRTNIEAFLQDPTFNL